MEWKLVLSTFSLIFLAELGDKTQLAAFAATASSRSPWSVFAGAASALVLSTLLAVLLGSTIQRFVPQQYLRLGAGILFVAFGVLLLAGVRGRELVVAPAPAPGGTLTSLVLATATDFEQAAVADYERMAAAAIDPSLRALLTALAAEERGHLKALRDTIRTHGQVAWDSAAVRPVEAMGPSVAMINDTTRQVLVHAAAHEQATARFYAELAKAAPLPGMKAAFARLADEERGHAKRLSDALRPGNSAR
jgi:rubrerythrin